MSLPFLSGYVIQEEALNVGLNIWIFIKVENSWINYIHKMFHLWFPGIIFNNLPFDTNSQGFQVFVVYHKLHLSLLHTKGKLFFLHDLIFQKLH